MVIFDILGAAISRVGSRTKVDAQPTRNKAERAAIAETLEAKVASMGKSSLAIADQRSKTPKPKKDPAKTSFHLFYPLAVSPELIKAK